MVLEVAGLRSRRLFVVGVVWGGVRWLIMMVVEGCMKKEEEKKEEEEKKK